MVKPIYNPKIESKLYKLPDTLSETKWKGRLIQRFVDLLTTGRLSTKSQVVAKIQKELKFCQKLDKKLTKNLDKTKDFNKDMMMRKELCQRLMLMKTVTNTALFLGVKGPILTIKEENFADKLTKLENEFEMVYKSNSQILDADAAHKEVMKELLRNKDPKKLLKNKEQNKEQLVSEEMPNLAEKRPEIVEEINKFKEVIDKKFDYVKETIEKQVQEKSESLKATSGKITVEWLEEEPEIVSLKEEPEFIEKVLLEREQPSPLERKQPRSLEREREQPSPLERKQPRSLEREQPRSSEKKQPSHLSVLGEDDTFDFRDLQEEAEKPIEQKSETSLNQSVSLSQKRKRTTRGRRREEKKARKLEAQAKQSTKNKEVSKEEALTESAKTELPVKNSTIKKSKTSTKKHLTIEEKRAKKKLKEKERVERNKTFEQSKKTSSLMTTKNDQNSSKKRAANQKNLEDLAAAEASEAQIKQIESKETALLKEIATVDEELKQLKTDLEDLSALEAAEEQLKKTESEETALLKELSTVKQEIKKLGSEVYTHSRSKEKALNKHYQNESINAYKKALIGKKDKLEKLNRIKKRKNDKDSTTKRAAYHEKLANVEKQEKEEKVKREGWHNLFEDLI